MDPKLRKLQAKWYKKLADKGFNDIEENGKLKRLDSDWFHKHVDMIRYRDTREFYDRCYTFLQTHQFQTPEHEHIFSLFCSGKTLKEIGNHVTLDESWIGKIVKGYLNIMREQYGK